MISERTFDPTNAAPGAARRFVLDEVGEAPKPVLESIRVMVSELASNAVLHARTEFRVRVERLGESLRVEVIDSGDGFPEPRLKPSRTAPTRATFPSRLR